MISNKYFRLELLKSYYFNCFNNVPAVSIQTPFPFHFTQNLKQNQHCLEFDFHNKVQI